MEIKKDMKMYDMLFGLNQESKDGEVKVTFTNKDGKPFTLSKDMMKMVWDYLNQPVNLKIELNDVSEENKITDKQKAIEAMKNAVNKRKRLEIDNKEVVRLKDEENMSFYGIAKMFGCTSQTIINRYNIEKGKEK